MKIIWKYSGIHYQSQAWEKEKAISKLRKLVNDGKTASHVPYFFIFILFFGKCSIQDGSSKKAQNKTSWITVLNQKQVTVVLKFVWSQLNN